MASSTTVYTVFAQSDLAAGTYTSPGFDYDGISGIGLTIQSTNWTSVNGTVILSAEQSFDGITWTNASSTTIQTGSTITMKGQSVSPGGNFTAVDGLGPRQLRVALTLSADMNIGVEAQVVWQSP